MLATIQHNVTHNKHKVNKLAGSVWTGAEDFTSLLSRLDCPRVYLEKTDIGGIVSHCRRLLAHVSEIVYTLYGFVQGP